MRRCFLAAAAALIISGCSAPAPVTGPGSGQVQASILAGSRPAAGTSVRGPVENIELWFKPEARLVELVVTGKLGREFTIDQGYAYARRVGLCLLASVKAEVGELSRVKRVIRIMGMVNATPEFTEHPKVMNGFSDLMVLAFGQNGLAARSSMGLSSLPFDAPVEVEAIVELNN